MHYSIDLLHEYVEVSGLSVVNMGSIIFKPFSNPQMDFLLGAEQWEDRRENDQEIRGLACSKADFFDGLYKMEELPAMRKHGFTLYAQCSL